MNSTVLPVLPHESYAASGRWEDQRDIVDALYRFGAGQDLSDAGLFASAFAEDAVLDFVQPAARFGISLPPFAGRDRIVESIMSATAPLRTTHTVTNPRVRMTEQGAHLFALVEAQHVDRDHPERKFLLKNIYDVVLVRAPLQGLWVIRNLRIENVWYEGEPSVLFRPTPPQLA